MKKYLISILLFVNFVMYAQTEFKKATLIETHLISWINGSFNLGVERQYAPNQSFTFSIFRQRYYPGEFLNFLDDETGHHLGNGYEARIGIKFFLTKLNEKTTRFYLEPQFRVSSLKGSYTDEGPSSELVKIKANATQMCLLFGFQKKLKNNFTFDMYMGLGGFKTTFEDKYRVRDIANGKGYLGTSFAYKF